MPLPSSSNPAADSFAAVRPRLFAIAYRMLGTRADAEAANAIPGSTPTDEDYAALRAQFSDNEIAELGYAIAVFLGWNMLNVSLQNPTPEVPAPGL